MVLYECIDCNFRSQYKNDLKRHLTTKKHLINQKNYRCESKKNLDFPHKSSQILTNVRKIPHKSSQILTNPHKLSEKLNTCEYSCEFCAKTFKRSDNLKRHIKKYCKKSNGDNEKMLMIQIEDHRREKEKLYEYIDKLIDKTGDTNINIENQTNNQMNNTINLKNFGEENTSHITDDYKLKMLSLPYGMIQNMIEKIHFNKKKPENKNIALTNKRDNMIKVFRGSGWKYQDRSYVVDELIKNNYYRLDNFFEEEGKNKMTDDHSKRYLHFQKKFDRQDDDLIEHIKRETEMIILSENL